MTLPVSRTRRAVAIFAGFLFVVVASTATDMLFHATGVFPPLGQGMSDALFAFALAYRSVFAIMGTYLTSRLAPTWVMPQAMVMGAIGLAVSTLGAVVTWDKGPEFGPHWYPVLLAVSSVPCSWAGVRLFLMRGHRQESSAARSIHV